MFDQLKDFVLKNEDWLMGRILRYAKQRDYTKYTSTLKEAWRLSISGLSKSLVEALNSKGRDLELGPHEDYVNEPASQFGILEAKRHRERGISLGMFLGLMKYYRQTYSDLIRESEFEADKKFQYEQIIKRFFDRVEIGFCTEWSRAKDDGIVKELQFNNREMTNEKNKYLTIFESLSMPVFIVGLEGTIDNMNHSASQMLNDNAVPGTQYYGEKKVDKLFFIEAFPWLKKLFKRFTTGSKSKESFETAISDNGQFFFVSFSRSLDISGKFSNTIVILENITKRKNMEKELEKLATTDPLTGAKNRRAFLNIFEKEVKRSKRYNHSLALLLMDIDHFKKINDHFGHDIGDKILQLLVNKSHKVLRNSDLFGRWGGEEFIILLPEIGFRQASFAAERLRGALEESRLAATGEKKIQFTVSIGFTMIDTKKDLIDKIIKRADEALYIAKQKGRNQVAYL